MVLLDPRRGSGELFEMLSRKVPCLCDENLPAGDFVMEGFCEGGKRLVGIERKKISADLLNSMYTGRFSGFQLTEMGDYFAHCYLIVEGIYRPNKDTGIVELFRRGYWEPLQSGNKAVMYADINHFLLTIANKTSVRVIRTGTPEATVQEVADIYSWHNGKTWEQHTSHLQMHKLPPPGQKLTFKKPSLRRKIACELPGISWTRSQAVERAFATTLDMMNATIEMWEQVEGIGKGIATKVFEALRGE